MYAIFYFIVVIIFFHKFECYSQIKARNINLNANEIENNVKMIMKPLKKLSGIFPNHNIEIQFDIEQAQYHPIGQVGLLKSHKQVRLDNSAYLDSLARTPTFGRPDFTANKYNPKSFSIRTATEAFLKDLPIHEIRRSNDLDTNSTSTMKTATTPQFTTDTDKQIVYMKDLKNALDDLEKKLQTKHCDQQEPRNVMPLSLKNSDDSLTLMNIVNTLKKNGPLQNAISKPSDEDLSWLKIKLPV